MKNNPLEQFPTQRWFYIFLITHLLCWTIFPIFTRLNLPLDTIEGSIWANHLQWGYDKDPYLNGWLSGLAIYLGGPSGWMTYLFCQLSVAAALWSIWQVAKEMLTPAYAFISVLMLEGVQYFNLHALDFNDNTLELGLWALTIYSFYTALTKTSTTRWLLTGFFAGLALMAKYYTLALFAGMALFLIIFPNNRKHLKTLPPYLALLVIVALVTPHIVWLFSHDFITIKYVFNRASSKPHWTNHFYFPLEFIWQQLQVFLPALALYCLLLIGERPIFAKPKLKLNSFNKNFLLFVCLGPFLLTILLSLFSGIKLRAGWGMPLLSFWGIILTVWLQPALTVQKLQRFLLGTFSLLALLLISYIISLTHSKTPSTANFPGKQIAKIITQEWHNLYHAKLSYVAGSRWAGGNIEFYSEDHPAIYIEWNKQKSPWIDEADFRKKGAVFIWEIHEHEELPKEIKDRFPTITETKVLKLNWLRDTRGIPPIELGIALLPPRG